MAFTCSELTRCEICSTLAIKKYFTPCSSVSVVNFEHVIADCFSTVKETRTARTIFECRIFGLITYRETFCITVGLLQNFDMAIE